MVKMEKRQSNGFSTVHPWQGKPQPISNIEREETYDIVVVGAGISGCVAAHSAAEAGAKVICVEKSSDITANGIDVGAIGTKLQKEAGIQLDKDLIARLLYQWGQSQVNYNLIRTYVDKSGEIFDYYHDLAKGKGLKISLNSQNTARSDWDTLEDRFKQFRTAHKFSDDERHYREDGKFVNANFVEMVRDAAKEHGVVFSFKTKAEQLIRENCGCNGDAGDGENQNSGNGGRVTGVIVSDSSGYKKLNATKGVILATGDIGGNKEMLECWSPLCLRADRNAYMPKGFNTGDGIIMGMWIGAARSRCYPAPIIHAVNFLPLAAGMDTSWLTVNREGKRFCCEVAWEPMVTNARMNAPGNKAFAIFDSHYPEHARKQEPAKFASLSASELQAKVEKAVQSGKIFKGETLEELAEAIAVPADNLRQTVAQYNKYCDSGFDPQFGVPSRFLCSVKDGPFYASLITSVQLAVPYGLHVDDNSQVCDEHDNPIPGLFAVGNVQGDFLANSYPVTVPGLNHGRCITFGRLVGQALAKS
jgi:fumarate reductase flavoprotein subunit